MNNRSIFTAFSDGTVAEVRSMRIQDKYEGLLEGTRSSLSRRLITEKQERAEVIEYLVEKGKPCGEFVVQPELVPEKWGDKYMGECIKEYSITTRFQIDGRDDCLELEVMWDASREEFMNFWESLDMVTRKIDFGRYCRHIDWGDLA